ncbi:hypothetical protein FDP41_008697 [Naegleria fowleri]|uniref:Uncharacterized protein n=1 Tax=Naegleria fowleri TaxID=5763 RepID=A0A6A5B0U7_NAEFO|nr:uncharacterized protein FDP41_008697 [Naegleria fowleri]KAF0973033.1 hypothetical protein FDP41_008697 [Naegleria fowleri]
MVTPLNSPSPSIHAMATSHHFYSSEGHEWVEREKKLGDVVDVVLNVLQNMALDAKLDEERLLMSVAELKHVRDCLKFQLPFQDREIDWIAKRLKSPRGSEEEDHVSSSTSLSTRTTNNHPSSVSDEEEIKKSLGTFVEIDFHESPPPPPPSKSSTVTTSSFLEPHDFKSNHSSSSSSQHKEQATKTDTNNTNSGEIVFHPLLK